MYPPTRLLASATLHQQQLQAIYSPCNSHDPLTGALVMQQVPSFTIQLSKILQDRPHSESAKTPAKHVSMTFHHLNVISKVWQQSRC